MGLGEMGGHQATGCSVQFICSLQWINVKSWTMTTRQTRSHVVITNIITLITLCHSLVTVSHVHCAICLQDRVFLFTDKYTEDIIYSYYYCYW